MRFTNKSKIVFPSPELVFFFLLIEILLWPEINSVGLTRSANEKNVVREFYFTYHEALEPRKSFRQYWLLSQEVSPRFINNSGGVEKGQPKCSESA